MPGFARFDIRQVGRRVITVLLAWLVLNVLVLALFVRPRVREFQTLEEESRPRLRALAQRQAEVEEEEAFVAGLRQAEADLVSLRDEVLGRRNTQMLPVRLELARVAAQFNVNMERVRYQHSDLAEEGLERMAMVVPLEAGYGNLRKFIQAIESSEKFLVVESVTLGQGKEGGSLLQLNITVATYFDSPRLRELNEGEEQRGRARPRPGRRT